MLNLIIEGVENLKNIKVFDALLGNKAIYGLLKTTWENKKKEKFIWDLYCNEEFVGDAALYLTSKGVKTNRTVAFIEFYNFKKEHKIKLLNKANLEINEIEIGPYSFKIEKVGNKKILLFDGSMHLYQDPKSMKVLPSNKNAKETAKILNALINKIIQEYGLITKIYGFGKIRNYAILDKFFFYSEDENIGAVLKLLGAKKKNLKSLVEKENKIVYVKVENYRDAERKLLFLKDFEDAILAISFIDPKLPASIAYTAKYRLENYMYDIEEIRKILGIKNKK